MTRRSVPRLPGPLRRIRAFAGHLGLLAALGLVAALLATGAPRLANRYADQGLSQDVDRLPYQSRDLIFTRTPDPHEPIDPAAAAARLDPIRDGLTAPLPGLVHRQWFSGQIGPDDLRALGDSPALSGGCRASLPLRAQPGLDHVATMVAGRWPVSDGSTVEAVISRDAAEVLRLGVDSQVTLTGRGFGAGTVPVRIVGIYQPVDPAAPDWDGIRLADVPCEDPTAGTTWRVPLLTDLSGLADVARRLPTVTYTWRYRVDEQRLSTTHLPGLMAAIGEVRRAATGDGPRLTTSLDAALSTFDAQLRSVRALVAVVQAGILATVLGLIALAAGLVVERRRAELTLLRARGASASEVGGWFLRETALVLPVAVLAGWALGRLAPGRPAEVELPLVAALVVGTTLAVPLLAMVGQRRTSVVGQRRDLVRHRPSLRRLTAEAVVLLLAVLGVVLLRQRELGQTGEVDPYLASVPVLLASAAALVALRIVPWPLRGLLWVAARARTAVPFLGLARAGRGAPVTVLPMAVLVVAVATGIFTSVVTSTVAEARDQVSDREVAADARIVSVTYLEPETGDRLAALPGVTAVSGVATEPGQRLRSRNPDGSGGPSLGQAQVMVMDGPSLAKVLAHSGIDIPLPPAFTRPGRLDGPVPAVVSPEVAEDLGPGVFLTEVQGRQYAFTVDTVASTFPGLAADARRFVVLPWQALPVPDFQPVRPDQFLVAGAGLSPAALTAAAEAGQRAYLATVLGKPIEEVRTLPVTVTTWEEHRRTLERSGVNRLLSFTFHTGVAGAVALALLAVGFAVLAEAPARGRVLSRLRTMGLSRRQGRGLLLYELVPLVGIAVLAGGLVGVALPRLLGPALDLTRFTGGLPAPVHVDPFLVAGVPLLVVVTLLAALGVESLVNRRTRLGEVLRLGEED
ncbi:FtsX-like permease family protein [Micromonospora sp. HM5-17]|uniref:FtsX-like permease family protein n=1 Tax=Micromonospora sp. HM5-17 TaxID=2487710 RepID=UPI000F49248F|nr:FtsX-like permease family protein [Micromonospora sp. HM5-17]ROT33789.1 FtsX-like permease family protein [Micromonospora sp. HM5-17]